MQSFFHIRHPIWAMAFRPLYLLAAIYGVVVMLRWALDGVWGHAGQAVLAGQWWHAHEMIWGYTGGIVVAFLLTAVATWTGQPPVRGRLLMVLVGLWLAARWTVWLGQAVWVSGVLGTVFFVLATLGMGQAVWRHRNTRHYGAVAMLFLLGLTQAMFHVFLLVYPDGLRGALWAGLMMVVALIALIGNRVIPFFTAKRLGGTQVVSPMWLVRAAWALPMAMAGLCVFQAALPVVGGLGVLAGLLGLWQSGRWWQRGVWAEPMLWVLHLGYALMNVGMVIFGTAQWHHQVAWQSIGIHCITVGGMGLLTLGMMTRTALGHTGRPLYPAPKGMKWAFWFMLLAAFLRVMAAMMMTVNGTAYGHLWRTAAVCFAVACGLYVWRYAAWLTQARIDGKSG